jgi:hypothetical protein
MVMMVPGVKIEVSETNGLEMRTTMASTLLFWAIYSGGCGRCYLLAGHNEYNLQRPPNITMRVGERRQAIWTGMSLMQEMPSSMSLSQDHTGIVTVEYPDAGTAFIRANKEGQARLHYWLGEKGNEGFLVTVITK